MRKFYETNLEESFWNIREKYLKLLKFSKQTMKVFRYWIVGFVIAIIVTILVKAKATESISNFRTLWHFNTSEGFWDILDACWVCSYCSKAHH